MTTKSERTITLDATNKTQWVTYIHRRRGEHHLGSPLGRWGLVCLSIVRKTLNAMFFPFHDVVGGEHSLRLVLL